MVPACQVATTRLGMHTDVMLNGRVIPIGMVILPIGMVKHVKLIVSMVRHLTKRPRLSTLAIAPRFGGRDPRARFQED